MLNIGSRSSPSVLYLVLFVIVIFAVADYVLVSLDTQDWSWFPTRSTEMPNEVIVLCYGNPIHLDRGSNHFNSLARMMNEILSRQTHYDLLSMSLDTYQGYQQFPGMVTIEFFYPAPRRVQDRNQINLKVDKLVVPLAGDFFQFGAILGEYQGVPVAGSYQVDSVIPLKEYLRNQNICLTATSSQ